MLFEITEKDNISKIYFINSLTHKDDRHLISPYNITHESHNEVNNMKIKGTTINLRSS